jgi:AcrR family transcriptional regulator
MFDNSRSDRPEGRGHVAPTDPTPDADLRRRPRQRRSRDTVAFVLEAAAQLFAERGYDAATTNAVAERAGVSIGTLYQYFASKDGLLLGLLDQHLDDAEAVVAARFGDLPTGRPDAAAQALVSLTAELNTHHPQLARLLHEQASRMLRAAITAQLSAQLSAQFDTPGQPRSIATGRPRTELRTELCVRLVEYLVHATALDPPPGANRAEVLAEITTIATACLADNPPPRTRVGRGP